MSIATLNLIEAAVLRSETILGANAVEMGGHTDRDTLMAILGIARRAIQEEVRGSGAIVATPASLSSVEIESRVKGAPGIKVKAYAGSDLEDPASRATEMFERLNSRYANGVPAAD